MYKELALTINLIRNNEIIRNVTVLLILSSIVVAVFISFLASLVILLSYLLGFLVCWSLTKYQTKASLYLQRFASFYRVNLSSYKKLGILCPICHSDSCKRHKINKCSPWKSLHISKELNDAVEHFYNKIINTFITSWYSNFTNDVTVLNELKVSLRYATASVVNRLLEIERSRIIGKKLIPYAVKHVDDYLCMQQISKLKNIPINDVAVEYLGRRLHAATTNRQNELNYLRHLTASIIPHILPSQNLECKNCFVLIREIIAGWVLLPLMDVLADPNMINSLVILLTTYKSKGHSLKKDPGCEPVEFLCNFVNNDVKKSSFACDLKTILKTTDLLYAFMQFLKKGGPVNILQFCLDIEEFNNKLLTPDMSKKQLENLHTEAVNLYKMYFDVKSPECIACSHEIESELRQLLQEGMYNVAKLRTSEPLFKAYDYAFGILEQEWLPGFFHSNEFYNFICGSKIAVGYNKTSAVAKSSMLTHGSPVKIRGKKYYEPTGQGTVAKISSGLGRIRGVLKSNQPIEGAIYNPDLSMYTTSPAFVEDILLSDCESIFRDLSAWRISIPSVEAQQFSGSKSNYIFNINVQRIDMVSENEIKHWIIQRKDQDFYTLKNKLIEFHGEGEISNSPLPARRITTSMEMRRVKYENFLHSLLQKPSLRGSDLLHTFLTTDQDFSLVVNSTVPVVEDLGNIYQSVAFKLRKEKGQHLDSFMNTFLMSTAKPKQKFEWAEVGDEMEIISPTTTVPKPATFRSSVFQNNFGIAHRRVQESFSTSFNPNGITESLFYLLKHTLKIRPSVLRLFAAACSVGQQAVESMCRIYIDYKLCSSLTQSNLTDLVILLEGVIFETSISSTKEELKLRKERAFKELKDWIPQITQTILGNDFAEGLLNLLEILQNPLFNKQLAYSLLDIVAAEMYPEICEIENK